MHSYAFKVLFNIITVLIIFNSHIIFYLNIFNFFVTNNNLFLFLVSAITYLTY